jgi:hypothetical protein
MDQKTSMGKITGETKYTYEGKTDKDLDKISVKPDVKIAPDPNAQVQFTVKSSKGKGETLFDGKAGRITRATTEMTMEMEVEFGGMTIPVNTTQTATLRLKGAAKGEKSSPPRDLP